MAGRFALTGGQREKRSGIKTGVLQILVLTVGLFIGTAYGAPPVISNLRFSDDPITIGETFTISFDYEGRMEKYAIENAYETLAGESKREVKEYSLKPDEMGKSHGQITLRWKTENPNLKPYRIFRVWGLDSEGKRGNLLSGEVKVVKPLASEDIKIPMQLKTAFSTKQIGLSATIFKPGDSERRPLLILNHGTPADEGDRKRVAPYKEQGRVFARKGFAVVLPIRRGHGTSEGDYAEYSGKCDHSDYDNVAKEATRDIRATVEFIRKEPYVDTEKKILLVGQSAGGFSSLAYASAYPDEVAAVINFAGGKGRVAPYKVCDDVRLVQTMGNFGKTFKGPTLWIYTEQDDYFEPKLAKKMFEAYKAKGGEATFVSFSSEFGHSFFVRATKTWEPVVDEFLKKIGSQR